MTVGVTIRPAFPDDARALARLAALDCQALPRGRMLVAEVGGELWAAVAVDGSATLADPFRRTTHVVELLRARAVQVTPRRARRLIPRFA